MKAQTSPEWRAGSGSRKLTDQALYRAGCSSGFLICWLLRNVYVNIMYKNWKMIKVFTCKYLCPQFITPWLYNLFTIFIVLLLCKFYVPLIKALAPFFFINKTDLNKVLLKRKPELSVFLLCYNSKSSSHLLALKPLSFWTKKVSRTSAHW